MELAQVFARFGSTVTIVEADDRLLPLEEPEASELLAQVLTAEGLALHTGVAASQVSHDGSMFTVDLADGTRLSAGRLLVATGRKALPERVGRLGRRSPRQCPLGAGGRPATGARRCVGRGGPDSSVRSMIYAYPTSRRGIEDALRSLS